MLGGDVPRRWSLRNAQLTVAPLKPCEPARYPPPQIERMLLIAARFTPTADLRRDPRLGATVANATRFAGAAPTESPTPTRCTSLHWLSTCQEPQREPHEEPDHGILRAASVRPTGTIHRVASPHDIRRRRLPADRGRGRGDRRSPSRPWRHRRAGRAFGATVHDRHVEPLLQLSGLSWSATATVTPT